VPNYLDNAPHNKAKSYTQSVSVITPSDRYHEWLYLCLQSVQTSFAGTDLEYEHLIIADGMNNEDWIEAERLVSQFPKSRIFKSDYTRPLGPGIARNMGVHQASGDWLMFLDSDDFVSPSFAPEISRALRQGGIHSSIAEVDLIGFNWAWVDDSPSEVTVGRRRDLDYLVSKSTTLSRYLRHQMDGSVIYSLFRRSMIIDSDLRFEGGYHEDVDFLFRSYLAARASFPLDKVIYRRRSHNLQITKRISLEHLDGYVRSWNEVLRSVTESACSFSESDVEIGKIGMIATRIQEIFRLLASWTERRQLLLHLARLIEQSHWNLEKSLSQFSRTTYYAQLVEAFVNFCSSPQRDFEEIPKQFDDLSPESSSFQCCDDLQESVFLAPSEVRTCCKRFYIDGERRGDVVLKDIEMLAGEPLSFRQIAIAKMRLIRDINQGDTTPCDGCPFLKRKIWPSKSPTQFNYISLEHHSVCNLRCTYCDETYFGGERPVFDIFATLKSPETLLSLEADSLFVWGGGEPLVDPEIDSLLEQLDELIPEGNHRFLSNATRYSDVVANLLKVGRASLVTSIDAGTESTFRQVRGRPGLDRVIGNLKKYASVAGTGQMILKYIITDLNSSEYEIESFCGLLKQYELSGATFQISSDFKSPSLSWEHLCGISNLFQSLVANGANYVYVDDLIRQRLLTEPHETISALARRYRCVRTPNQSRPFTLFGAGEMTHLLLKSVGFQSRWKIAGIVDSTPAKVGTHIGSFLVEEPKSLLASHGDILISASQGVIDVFHKIQQLGIGEDRVVRDLII